MSVNFEGRLADRSTWKADDCSIGRTMEVIGSRSAMLLLRESFYGTTRFDDFAQRVGITDGVAAARLKQLAEAGILEKRPYREEGQRTRYEYIPTEKGRDLFPVVVAMMLWGDKHLQHSGGPLNAVEHSTGESITVEVLGRHCTPLDPEDVSISANQEWLARHHNEVTADEK